jgi:folate-binding protein YgfZ
VSRSPSELLALDGGAAPIHGWSLVDVIGRHRERFLSSQVTSDVDGLAVGDSQLSALLDRSGRLQGFFFLRKADDAIELLVPDECVDRCLERFESHVIADDVEFRRRDVGPLRLALGPAAVIEPAADDRFPVTGWGSAGFVSWDGAGRDLPEIPEDELERRRILGGPPTWGRDVRPGQLINETSLLDTAVAFDKGCYLGQETVAKVASHRGAVRGPVLLELTAEIDEAGSLVGQPFSVGSRSRAGEVLARVRWEGSVWLLVVLHRDLRIIGRTVRADFADGRGFEAVIRRFPLLAAPGADEMADRLTVAASAAFATDETDRALELLGRAVELCPAHADAFESLGVILGRLGRHEEAIRQMLRLLEIDPSSIMAHSNLSLYFNQLGDIERAEHHLGMATRLSMGGSVPTRDEETEAEEADRRRREEMFRRVLEIDPDDVLAHFGMGELLVEREQFGAAAEHLERVVAAEPGHSAALLALGRAFEGLGDGGRALQTYESGVETAAKKGDFATAQKMQDRITALASQTP